MTHITHLLTRRLLTVASGFPSFRSRLTHFLFGKEATPKKFHFQALDFSLSTYAHGIHWRSDASCLTLI
jgi:hypothetical protein